MDQAPPLETVYQAVDTLYNNPDTTEKERASQWLGELQKSVFSWKIADEMLQQKRNLESCYFAAQTMRTKIQNSFHELPTEAHNSLRDSLLEHISQTVEGTSGVIVTQLCLALADLALQMTSWQKPVLDLISKLSPNVIWPLLEILTVLPEELSSRSLRLGANRRNDVVADFNACAPTVNELLRVCITNSGDNVTIDVKIIRCFTSWVSVNAITLDNITENVVFLKTFQILANHSSVMVLHEAAADCICTLLHCLEDNNNQSELEHRFFLSVSSLEQAYHMSVADEDDEKSINYCRVFTELGEALLEKIVVNCNAETRQHYGVKVFDLVLICVGHHDYEVAEITFNLWYRLSEELYQKNSDTLIGIFRPYIERLLGALCRHAEMDEDHNALIDDTDDFKDFRQKVSDLIKDVVFIVGSSNCFRQMFINLQAPDVTWNRNEAALFVMQAVAKNILPEENDVVPKVVEAIVGLPENTHPAVKYTSLLLLGELCEWVDHHASSLEPILMFLLSGLQRPGLAGAAANALQSICSACKTHMLPHLVGLLNIMQQIDSFSITNEQVIGLLRGIAVIISCMPPTQLSVAMRELCMIQINPLIELIDNDFVPVRGTKSDPVIWLDRLSAIFRNTNIVENGELHPCQSVINELWPVLSRACDKYQTDARIMERCCRCLRFAIRCIGKRGAYLVQPLVEQITRLYSTHRHSCYLYLGSILVDEYGADSGCIVVLLEMLSAFIKPTFERLQEENGMKNHPDTVDDFFRLCTRFLQRAPVNFIQCQALPAIIQCALLACNLEHRDANATVMHFFTDLVLTGRNHDSRPDFPMRKQLVRALLQQSGQLLVNNLVHASVFYLHSYMLSNVSDVLLELQIIDADSFSVWLENAIKSLPTQSATGCISVTSKQMLDFHVSVTRSDSSKSIYHALRDFTRLYR